MGETATQNILNNLCDFADSNGIKFAKFEPMVDFIWIL
jgi:hypothetical protein